MSYNDDIIRRKIRKVQDEVQNKEVTLLTKHKCSSSIFIATWRQVQYTILSYERIIF